MTGGRVAGWLRAQLVHVQVTVVLLIGIPWVLAQMVFYGLRLWIFKVPVHGDWGERGQVETHRKGPNTWN